MKETKKERLERLKSLDRAIIRGAHLLQLAATLRAEIKIMKYQIHNMALLAKQAEDYSTQIALLSSEQEPTLTWIIGANFNKNRNELY